MPVCILCGTTFEGVEGVGETCPVCKGEGQPQAIPGPQVTAPPPQSHALRWVLLGVLALFVFVILLAEGGVVTAENHETNWKADGRYEFESSWAGPRGRAVPLRGVSFTPTVTVSVPRGNGYDLATEASTAIKKAAPARSGEGESKLEITITQVTPLGATWVPFHKDGSCTFSAKYTLAANTPWSAFAARGQVNGEVTQKMTGVCSSGLYRQKMAEAIAQAILSDISKLVAKHS